MPESSRAIEFPLWDADRVTREISQGCIYRTLDDSARADLVAVEKPAPERRHGPNRSQAPRYPHAHARRHARRTVLRSV